MKTKGKRAKTKRAKRTPVVIKVRKDEYKSLTQRGLVKETVTNWADGYGSLTQRGLVKEYVANWVDQAA
jgi:hypothetical protein